MMKNTSVITLAVSTCFISLMLLTFSVTAESGVTGYGNYNLSLTCESMALPQDKPDAGQADPKDKTIKDLKSQVESLTDSVDRQNGRIEDLNKTIANQESLLDSLKTQEVSDSGETADGDGQQAAENEKKSGNFFYIVMIFLILGVSITALVLTLLIMFRMPRKNKIVETKVEKYNLEPQSRKVGSSDRKVKGVNRKNDYTSYDQYKESFEDSQNIDEDLFEEVEGEIKESIKKSFESIQSRCRNEYESEINSFKKQISKFENERSGLNLTINTLTDEKHDLENKVKEYDSTLNNYEAEKKKEIEDVKKKLNGNIASLTKEKEELISTQKKELERIDKEHEKIINDIKELHCKEIESLKKEQDEKLKKYSKSVKIYNGCEEFSKPAVELFEQIDGLRKKQLGLCEKVRQKNLSDEVKDEFNYYYTYVVGKYEKAIKDFDVKKFEREFFMLNKAGMALTGQTIDDYLKTSDSKQYVANLQHLSYEAGLGKLCGAAVVLSDDLCSLSRFCKDSVSERDVKDFGDITKELLKTIRGLGYVPAYVKLFESIKMHSDKAEVINKKELDGFADGDIVEVLKMAVNFGEKKSKTQVCTKG